ncbi:MAG TPA: bifunctional phosphopantothenoylcysteine decarboxylase/phosphopantothenate--cysteine ligase CoaBC [Spirochaetia bacterium]|nr:bifunctional phosphopantothenoylcysteine decarboxylase/phosphopantothenate--cysteine ligase CoaBC [Spirochaetia bacterium]
MKILFGVSSSIAVYKALDVISQLKKNGHEIRVIMTENASKMVSAIPFFTLSGYPVAVDEFEKKDYIPHISLSDWADIMIIAPATANILGKMANGIADDLLSSAFLAFNKPVLAAPAMNVKMYYHPAVQKNMETLKNFGVDLIEPAEGLLACGYAGKGKLAPVEEIIERIESFNPANLKPLKNKKIIVTAGGTIEDIDPVRFITNRSSGKMGIAFAETAHRLGANVTLIHGSVTSVLPAHLKKIAVRSALELLEVLKEEIGFADILIMAAAVADYRPEIKANHKIKKKDETALVLQLVKNPDILKELSSLKKEAQIFAGFALETENLLENAKIKLESKKLDLIIANSPSNFEKETGEVKILYKNGKIEDLASMEKEKIAEKVYERILML